MGAITKGGQVKGLLGGRQAGNAGGWHLYHGRHSTGHGRTSRSKGGEADSHDGQDSGTQLAVEGQWYACHLDSGGDTAHDEGGRNEVLLVGCLLRHAQGEILHHAGESRVSNQARKATCVAFPAAHQRDSKKGKKKKKK